MIGKSTVSMLLASKLLYPCISTDDIGTIFQAISGFEPMKGQFYLDYYANTDKQKLIADMVEYHKMYEPAILSLINGHSAPWSSPIIIEGYALYPCQLSMINNESVFAIWLIADDELLDNRLADDKAFYQNAKEPEKVIENYLHRSKWYNEEVYKQCKVYNHNHIIVKKETTADEVAESILKLLHP